MKRFIAGLIALTAAMGAFTACADKKGGKSDVTGVISAESTTEAPVYSSQEEAVRAFIEAYNEKDYQKAFVMQTPDGMLDVEKLMTKSKMAEGKSVEELIRNSQFVSPLYGGSDDRKLEFKRIVSTEPVDDENELNYLRYSFAIYEYVVNYINDKGGPDNVDPDEISEELSETMSEIETDELERVSNVTDACRVRFELAEKEKGDTYDGMMYLLGYKGGWKVTLDVIDGMDIKGMEDKMNDEANDIWKAANTALVEMDEEGALGDASQGFIVSSDSSLDYKLPDGFDKERFVKKLNNYFDSASRGTIEWFVEIKDGLTVVAAAYDPAKPDFAGYYPDAANRPDYSGMSFKEIYVNCCNDLI